jgi:16S rRNA (cytosine967-C5)-methyltransferase
MIAPARLAAYDILSDVSSGRADLPSAIARARETLRDERDRALATDIATGVQRWRGRLDHIITVFARRAITRLDREVVEVLRIGAYQLLFLTRVPASAVVDDAVKLTGKIGKRSAAGLVNAVLRTIARRSEALPLPAPPADPGVREQALDYLAVTLSHPRWLAERWYDRLGFERAAAWMAFNNQPAPLTLRANTIRTSAADLAVDLAGRHVATHPGRFAPASLIVDAGQPLRDPGADAGLFVVQDEASQLVTMLAGAAPGPLLLDACASPGGKATAFAASLERSGRVVACDVRDRRVELLRRTVRTTGAGNVSVVQADLARALPFGPVFSCVVVDAPCSGLGTLRRDPDIRWRRTADDLPRLAAAQQAMLREAASAVAPGGRLVYSTCSSESEENDDVVDAFLRESPDFRALIAADIHPGLPAGVCDEQGRLRTSPDRQGLEVFFGAVLERSGRL